MAYIFDRFLPFLPYSTLLYLYVLYIYFSLHIFLIFKNDVDNVTTTYAISHYIFEIFTPFSFNFYSKFTPF